MNIRHASLLAVAALAAAPAPAAIAATSRTYTVSVTGEQQTAWSYQGNTPGNCGGTQVGSGSQELSFRSAPKRIIAAAAGAHRWVVGDGVTLHVDGRRTGTFVQSADSCTDAPEPSPTDGCGERRYDLQADLGHGLDHPLERLNLSTTGDDPFDDCPYFQGPDDASFLDQNGNRAKGILPSADGGAGLRFAAAALSSRTLARGRSFSVSRRIVKPYSFHGRFGSLTGHTTLRWTVTFAARRRR
jgi:hypothetical protein